MKQQYMNSYKFVWVRIDFYVYTQYVLVQCIVNVVVVVQFKNEGIEGFYKKMASKAVDDAIPKKPQ